MTEINHEAPKNPFGVRTAEHSSIAIKGRPGALELLLDPDAPLLSILKDLQQHIEQNQDIVQGTSIRLNFGTRSYDALQFHEIKRILRGGGISLQSVEISSKALEDYLEDELEVSVSVKSSESVGELSLEATARPEPTPVFASPSLPVSLDTIPEPIAPVVEIQSQVSTLPVPSPVTSSLHFLIKTCRAGYFRSYEGDVVVFGDINDGAELRATGNIFVMGSLRGLAHAGFGGNNQAILVAYDLSPTQLRLGSNIAIAPQGEERKRKKIELEIAYVNASSNIEIEVFNGKMPLSVQKAMDENES